MGIEDSPGSETPLHPLLAAHPELLAAREMDEKLNSRITAVELANKYTMAEPENPSAQMLLHGMEDELVRYGRTVGLLPKEDAGDS